jgi:hypothetical protein
MMFQPLLTPHHSKQTAASSLFASKNHSPFFTPASGPKIQEDQSNVIGEQKANAISENVMRMPAPSTTTSFFNAKTESVSSVHEAKRDHEHEDERQPDEEEYQLSMQITPVKSNVQMASENGGGDVVPNASSIQEVVSSPGQAIEGSTKSFMESRFGYDFSKVQIHDSSLAHESAADIHALAYTNGNHVAFAKDQYRPSTDEGKKLLAHELTHVIQQSATSNLLIQRAPETWLRGQGTGVAASSPGGAVHDLGDGLYLTNSPDVASQYASIRAASLKGSSPEVLSGNFERSDLGRVLDLTQNVQWQSFLSSKPVASGQTYEALIRLANQNYWPIFNEFLRKHNLDLNNYDTIIGQEFVRGGNQACIRNRTIAQRIMGLMRPYTPDAKAAEKEDATTPMLPGGSVPGVPVKSQYSVPARITAGGLLAVQAASFVVGKIGDKVQEDLAQERVERVVKNFYQTQADFPELGAWVTIYWQVINHADAGSVRTFFDVSVQTGTTELEAKKAPYTSYRNLPDPQYLETSGFFIEPVEQLPYADRPTPFPKIAIGTFAPNVKTQLQRVDWGGVRGFSGNGMFVLTLWADTPPIFAILKPPETVPFRNGKIWDNVSIDISHLSTNNDYNIPVVNDLKAALVSPLDSYTTELFGFGVKGLEISDSGQLMNLFAGTRWIPAESINIISTTDFAEVEDTDIYRQISLLSPNGQTIITQIISTGPKGLKFPMEWLKKFDAILPVDLSKDEVKELLSHLKPVESSTLDEVLAGFQKAIASLPSRSAVGKAAEPGSKDAVDGMKADDLSESSDMQVGNEYTTVSTSDELLVDVPPANFDDVIIAVKPKVDISKIEVDNKIKVGLKVQLKKDNSTFFEGVVETIVLSISPIDDLSNFYELKLTNPKAISFKNEKNDIVKQLAILELSL